MQTIDVGYVVKTRSWPLNSQDPQYTGLMVLVKRDPKQCTKENRNRFLVPPEHTFEVRERDGQFYLDLYLNGEFTNSIEDIDL